jgi:glycosyltransferase involved in cell wall biosynthesis
MNVLHVIPAIADRYGGPSSSIRSMCRALEAHGVRTLIACTDADGDSCLHVPLGLPVSWHGVRVVFFPRQQSEAFKYSQPLAAWLDRHVQDFSIVHIHGVLSHAPIAAGRAARRHGIPYIVRPLGTLSRWSLAQTPFTKRLLLNLGGLQMLRHAAVIHYTSLEEQQQAEGALRLERGRVIPLGVEDALIAEPAIADADKDGNRYVLALSRLHPVKNLDTLIDAFVDARDARDANDRGCAGWRLVIAGDGDERYAARLREVVQRRGVADSIRFEGWVDGDRKRRLIREASIFVLPSLHESFGVSLVEAMASGVPPLVSSGVHLGRAIADDGAGWVTAPDRGALTAGLTAAMTMAEDRAARGSAARRVAVRFAWGHVATELADMYSSPVSRAVRPLHPSRVHA